MISSPFVLLPNQSHTPQNRQQANTAQTPLLNCFTFSLLFFYSITTQLQQPMAIFLLFYNRFASSPEVLTSSDLTIPPRDTDSDQDDPLRVMSYDHDIPGKQVQGPTLHPPSYERISNISNSQHTAPFPIHLLLDSPG